METPPLLSISSKFNFMSKTNLLILFSLFATTIISAQSKQSKPNNGETKSSSGSVNPFYNVQLIQTVYDLPSAQNNEIKLNPTKVYMFSGMVNISPYYITLNGASVRGNDPSKDGVMSSVEGAVLRSTDTDILMEKLGVVLLSPATMAYDFSDKTGTKMCNLLAGNSVVETPETVSGGVGRMVGFNSIYLTSNYWRCRIGLKLSGRTGKFCASYNYITGIAFGAAIEFTSEFKASDVDLSNNYFVYSGQTGVQLTQGAEVDQGRISGNLFRGVANLLKGFDSHSPGWEMRQNGASVPDTRPYSYLYMADNQTATTKFISPNLYTKIEGKTTDLKTNSFNHDNNRFTYNGKRPLTVRAHAIIGARAPENNSDFAIALMKNGLTQIAPNASKVTMTKGEGFQIVLETVVDLLQGDFIEVYIKNNNTTTPIIVRDLQFRISE
jgi:hypothetical protein